MPYIFFCMYDLIILGGGPAGLSAAIYAARYMLNTLVIAKEYGGMINYAHKVENYPGYKSISGMELCAKMKEQVEGFGVETKEEDIKGVRKKDDYFEVNGEYKAKKIIVALGTERRKLRVDGEDKYLGKGVSYCATCDSIFFRDKIVGVVGGANAAADAALLLADIAKNVYVIYRKDKLRCEPKRSELIEKNENIDVIYSANVKEIKGENMLKSIVLDNGKELELDGLFIEIGSTPSTAIVKELGVGLSEDGCIKVDQRQATNLKGAYAAGDITTNSNNFRQVVTATAEGAIAAWSVYEELKKE